jgi:ligand-binding sensor domain-containing protein
LPDIPTNAFTFDPLTPGVIYVGTDIGVFRSTNDGQTWDVLKQGMPPVVVTALVAHPSGLLQAATYGRGVYEINLRPATLDNTDPATTHKENQQ